MRKAALFIFFLSSIFYLLFSVNPVSAQIKNTKSNQPTNAYNTPSTNPDVPKNLHTWTQSVMIEVTSAMICQLAGVDPISPNKKCLGLDLKTGKIGYVENGGAIGMMGGLIAVLYEPPLHTSDYFSYLSQNFGLVKPTYAQGIGFQGLTPLIKIWIGFRNIVYLLFVLIFVIIGLAIMLRIKIDPRTVMTIENQIPKIIISLLLITFSFAIAGFLIDLMYVSIYLVFSMLADPQVVPPTASRQILEQSNNVYANNPINALNELIPGGFLKIAAESSGGVKDIVSGLFLNTNPSNASSIWDNLRDLITFSWIKDALVHFLSWLGMVLAFLIILVAVLWSMFRLWFQLIVAYVTILINVILAPFIIVSGVIPGGPGMGAWLKGLLANLSAFPATIGMFLLAEVFMEAFKDQGQSAFIPPLIGNLGMKTGPLGSLIGLGIILMTPGVVSMMKEVFKSQPLKATASIGQALGVAPGLTGGLTTAVASPYGSLAMYRGIRKEISGMKMPSFIRSYLGTQTAEDTKQVTPRDQNTVK